MTHEPGRHDDVDLLEEPEVNDEIECEPKDKATEEEEEYKSIDDYSNS